MDKKEITGKVIFKRSDTDDCQCCEGKHVYCQYVEFDKTEKVHTAFGDNFLRGVLHKFIGDKEGKKIKITIEEVEDKS